jgi:adenylate kinase family enzyme
MISLVNILNEGRGEPKAIILAGAPGAGKGYVLNGLDLGGLKTMNIDNIFIDKLKQANVTLDLKNATPEERSEQAKAMAAANKEFKGELQNVIAGKESFVLDGTAASYKQTVELKQQLEEAGYKVAMLYVYTDLEKSLKQNQSRFDKSGGEDRSLAPGIVMRTWKNVTDNLDPYFDLFFPHFIAVANTLEGDKIDNVEDIIKKYLDPYKPTGTKPKTPAQQKKSEEQKAELNAAIQTMLSNEFNDEVLRSMISKEEAQMRIAQFLRS